MALRRYESAAAAFAFLSLTAALSSIACGRSTPAPSTKPATATVSQAPRRAPFAVAIVVDQLSAWVAASRWPELPKDGGFARLVREGTWVKNMRYPYGVTDTAPGHAALHTGKVPAESGIVANELPDGNGGKVTILRDDSVRAVTATGVRPTPGSSAARLRADTVADRLRAAHPDALVVSVSVKDRGAILPAGKHPTHVMWFDAALDSFVTSTAFAQSYPRWATSIGDTRAVAAARQKPWELGDRAWVAEHAAGPDDQPGEGDLDGLGITFPHVARTGASFRALPASDEMILALGLAAVEAEYDPSKPTLLLLSMSASDVIGHVFGPDSWEAWDQVRKLDAKLAGLLDTLDRKYGPVSVLVAADHGNLSMPEIPPARAGVSCPSAQNASPPPDPYGRPCAAGTRLEPDALQKELVASAKAALGEGHWISGIADPYVFVTPGARALPTERRAVLDKAIRATFAKHQDGIEQLIDTRELAQRCPDVLATAKGIPARARAGEPILTLVCRAWAPVVGAGDYYMVPRVGSVFDGEIVIGKGASHGSPHLYDRTVSMLVRAPGAVAAGATIDDPVDFSAFAALEAAFVGLDTRAPRDILEAHIAR
ncbi:MAG: Alkaline phosphatase [Labilithrix sp.]|nr:Alkaline phosphatase [Labilithrix sp.]